MRVMLVDVPETFEYRGVLVDGWYGCAMNELHAAVFGKGNEGGFVVTFMGEGNPSLFRALDVSEFVIGSERLDESVIRHQRSFLLEQGLHIAGAMSAPFRKRLLYLYALQSALCYAEWQTESGVCGGVVTKNVELVRTANPGSTPETEMERMCGIVQSDEWGSGHFNVFQGFGQGRSIERHGLEVDRMMYFTTLYSARQYMHSLLCMLHVGTYEISFYHGNRHWFVDTTRDPERLSKGWTVAGWENVDLNAWFHEKEVGSNRLSIAVPDLGVPGQCFIVPIFEIENLIRLSP